MSLGDIAGLIAAIVFAVLVALIGVPLIKLGRVLDETKDAIHEASEGMTPILEETAETLRETNKQLARVDVITKNVADVTGNVSALVALVAATVGGPLIKLAGFSAAVRAAFTFGKPKPDQSKQDRPKQDRPKQGQPKPGAKPARGRPKSTD